MFLKFLRDQRGSILPIFVIAAVPLVVVTGAVVDYTNAFHQRTVVQDSMDAAALAAGKQVGLMTTDQVKAEAVKFFNANVGSKLTITPTLATGVAGANIDLSTTLHVPTYFLGLIGLNEFVFNLAAKATSGIGTLEVVMALDNSGSMSGSKISTLKTAATSLADTLYALGATSTKPDPVKIGLVPFAGSVKVGPQYSTATWLDTGANGTYHGDAQKLYGAPSTTNNLDLFARLKNSSGTAIAWAGCVEERPAPYDVSDDAASAASTLFVPMFAPDEPDNWTCSTGSCSNSGSSSSNRRYNGAPTGSRSYNNYLPDSGDATSCASAFPTYTVNASTDVFTSTSHGLSAGSQVVFQTTGSMPGGLTAGTTYYVISSGLTSSAFKVSTSSGGSARNITSSGSGTHRFTRPSNWTCQSGSANCGGTNNGKSEASGFGGLNIAASPQCKYGTTADKATVANVTVNSFAGGPNYMCTTTAVTPLTATSATITTAINAQLASGYTNITAGIMWGWRLLSPGEPFTEGRAYTDNENKKILILMTDGANTYNTNSKFLKSFYSAWGYVAMGHLGTTSSTESVVVGKMEERMAAACANAKTGADPNDPADDITIYTVAFQITDPTTLALLTACATDTSMAYQSSSPADLLAAFTAIGDEISLLRISQ